jgi:phage terminase small subunit
VALTGRKRLFADAVLAGKSNKEAAVAAGYSTKTASAAGARLAKDKDVTLYLAAARVGRGSVPPSSEAPKRGDATQDEFDLAAVTNFRDPKAFLVSAMNDGAMDMRLRVDAAKALMPYTHQRKGEGGKKEAQADAARKAASKFSSLAPPKLIVNNRK